VVGSGSQILNPTLDKVMFLNFLPMLCTHSLKQKRDSDVGCKSTAANLKKEKSGKEALRKK